MKKLPILCPQEYDVVDMKVVPCTRCSSGWSQDLRRCTIDTGAEHLPLDQVVPKCPIEDQCQHQIQQPAGTPCAIRARGMICESALVYVGQDPDSNPASFSAYDF